MTYYYITDTLEIKEAKMNGRKRKAHEKACNMFSSQNEAGKVRHQLRIYYRKPFILNETRNKLSHITGQYQDYKALAQRFAENNSELQDKAYRTRLDARVRSIVIVVLMALVLLLAAI